MLIVNGGKNMKKNYVRVVSLVLSVLMLLGISGCGSKEVNNNSDGKQKEIELTYWHIFVGADAQAKSMDTLMNEFAKSHPNIKITEEKIPHDQYKTKLKTQAAAKQLPDIFIIWPNVMTKEFVSAGLITDITDYLNNNAEWKNGFNKGSFNDYTVDGKIYSVPLSSTVCSVVYYNKALFDKYGLQYPKTFDDLKNVVSVFKNNGIIPIAFGDKEKWPAQSCLFSLFADRMTGTEWFSKAVSKNGAKFTDAEFVDALKRFKELADLGAFNSDYLTIDDVQARDYFYSGKAAMTINGSWMMGDVSKKASEDVIKNIGVEGLPVFSDGKGLPNTVAGATGIGPAINSKISKEKKEAALELIKFISDKHAFETYASDNILVPYNVKVDESKSDPVFAKLIGLVQKNSIIPVYDSMLSSEATEQLNNGLQELLLEKSSPDEIAQKIQKSVENK